MRLVLLDNATISSALRALGFIAIREPSVLDVEQAALERVCEAVLLADKLLIPDNYKPEFRDYRKSLLAGDYVEYVPVSAELDQSCSNAASYLAKVWFDAFDAGSERGTFNEYFSQVQCFAKFIWEYSSSEFFLVFRAVGLESRHPLIEAFLASETASNQLATEVKIIARDGSAVDAKQFSPHVRRMTAVLAWLGHQYVWYQTLAAQYGAIYGPHPLREFFAFDFLARLERGRANAEAFSTAFQVGADRYVARLRNRLDEFGLTGRLPASSALPIPVLLPTVIKSCSSRDEFFLALSALRADRRVRELRELVGSAQDALDRADVSQKIKLAREIESVGIALLRERGIEQQLLRVKPPTEFLGISVEGEDAGISKGLPQWLYKQLFLHRKYRAFVKDVMGELATLAQLGVYKDMLKRFAVFEGTQYPAFYTKKEPSWSKYHHELDSGKPPTKKPY